MSLNEILSVFIVRAEIRLIYFKYMHDLHIYIKVYLLFKHHSVYKIENIS